jgi:hypothetical protein
MRKGLLVGVGVGVGLLAAARSAQAQPDELREGPWYGWQVVLADATAVAMLGIPVSAEAGPLTRGMGMTVFLMNGPIVHMAHRNPRSASVSLLRLPLLLLGRLAGAMTSDLLCKTEECGHTARVLGAGIGVLPVVLFDWANAQRPPRSYWAADDRPRLVRPRLDGWAAAFPLLGGTF